MKKRTLTKIACVLTAGVAAAFIKPALFAHSEKNEDGTYNVTEDNRETLLGISNPDDYFLGAASQFSVFLNGDFNANQSDCEGRLAVSGNATKISLWVKISQSVEKSRRIWNQATVRCMSESFSISMRNSGGWRSVQTSLLSRRITPKSLLTRISKWAGQLRAMTII